MSVGDVLTGALTGTLIGAILGTALAAGGHLIWAISKEMRYRRKAIWDLKSNPLACGTYLSRSLFESPQKSQSSLPRSLRSEPVIGFRAFRLEDDGEGPCLYPIVFTDKGYAWQLHGKATRCLCPHAQVGAPTASCNCGLYACSQLGSVAGWIEAMDLSIWRSPGGKHECHLVVTAVMGWGKVIQHGNEGWRARDARIVAIAKDELLYVSAPYSAERIVAPSWTMKRLAERYQTELVPSSCLEMVAREFGSPLPMEDR